MNLPRCIPSKIRFILVSLDLYHGIAILCVLPVLHSICSLLYTSIILRKWSICVKDATKARDDAALGGQADRRRFGLSKFGTFWLDP